ncbi:protein FAM217A [Sorex araneus]|uniref:protein FAM217A n=1 Tax=Sorex araneus TaxID=42254 RepID=UPI002433549C|nr:protein FAM217A [Sorex araneus]
MGRRSGESGASSLRVSHVSQESLPHWNLDSEVPAPESKAPLAGRESAAGGKINKNHLEIPVEQLIIELSLPEHSPRRTQNSKQGPFHLWSYPQKEDSPAENRDFRKGPTESGFSVSSGPVKLFTLRGLPAGPSVEKPVRPYAGLQMPLGLCWPYADGDFYKDKTESPMALFSAAESHSGEALPGPRWDLKPRVSVVEDVLTDESDFSENEKANDALLSYFKKMDLNLKPEKIDTVEGSFTEGSGEAFPYPDFLPPPLNTLDLHKLAFSRSESWKVSVEPLEGSMDPLLTRLLEMERLQHSTVQKERPRLQTTFCPAVTEGASSSRAAPKARQPKPPDAASLQTPCADKSREKRKSNPASCKFEQNPSKWNWGGSGKYKWNGRPSSFRSPATTKQAMAGYDDAKISKSSTLSPYQDTSAKPPTAPTGQSLVRVVSTRCLPPRSPGPVSPLPLPFPEYQKEELKVPRTKKKLYRKNIALNRPFYIQKLNCLSPTFIIAKDKCSPIDQK